ncbi:MAG: hypothetical protein K2L74_09040 [Muribaculaceae bacterium]|nr:hypothetical protein [Muribaculaceae bacterium]
MKLHMIFPALALLAGCRGTAPAAADTAAAPEVVQAAPEAAPAQAPARMLLRATVYKTSVPCADNVAIGLNAAGTAVQSFPAPSDVSAASAPLQLPGGWLLDRRGIAPNTAFIRLTYAQYAALPEAPSTAELMKMIIPGARVTEMRRLSMTPQEAAADTAAVMAEINAGTD